MLRTENTPIFSGIQQISSQRMWQTHSLRPRNNHPFIRSIQTILNNKIFLIWCPGYYGIQLNVKADLEANVAATKTIVDESHISVQDA